MITIEVNNQTIEAKSGQTILAALKAAGVTVPTLCHLDDLPPSGACRMCVVEVEGRGGLIPSCAYPVAEGMKIKTHSPRVVRARKTIIELLLADHPDDCLYCVRSGNCELQKLAEQYGVRERRFTGARSSHHLDTSSPSIVRDPAKCILCGRCVRVCEEIQGVSCIDFLGRGSRTIVGTAFNQGLNVSSCIHCGQCILACPTGALREQDCLKEVFNALKDPDTFVVVQHAPSVSVSLAEEFGMKPGVDVCGIMTAALRQLGFDRVFDTGFSADLTIMEEASELARRIRQGGPLPMLTSCSPGWIKFVEQFYPDFMPHLSTCKSPQQMMGAILKSYFAETEGIDPARIFSVSIMPCTAKKFEAQRPEMIHDGIADIDAVITTREFAKLIRAHGLELSRLAPDVADSPFGMRSSAGKLFGATGGVMEAALRTAHYLLTGSEMPIEPIKELRGLKGIKRAHLQIGELQVGVAVASNLSNARALLDEIAAGRSDLHFIEVMTCPGGCINGGGQPLHADPQAISERMKRLYKIDRDDPLHCSHNNPEIIRLYRDYLGEPLGERSHQLLHTHYSERTVYA
ncbi:MAG: iron hydrogenase small subunit [Sedimentisphaerales bacterium]|nr:iron hydrogenase small subunit [Sedimentisphaerales bacterium]